MTETTESDPPSRIEIDAPSSDRPIDAAWLSASLARAAAELGCAIDRLAIAIVSDRRMRELHRRHGGVDTTTDVLTFAASEPDKPIDADVAICLDEAERRAAEFGHPVDRELLLYALHGLLHCCGFDDRDEADARTMHEEEDRILRLIGVGATFASPSIEPQVAGSRP